jgi:hypothetical protein
MVIPSPQVGEGVDVGLILSVDSVLPSHGSQLPDGG